MVGPTKQTLRGLQRGFWPIIYPLSLTSIQTTTTTNISFFFPLVFAHKSQPPPLPNVVFPNHHHHHRPRRAWSANVLVPRMRYESIAPLANILRFISSRMSSMRPRFPRTYGRRIISHSLWRYHRRRRTEWSWRWRRWRWGLVFRWSNC